MAKPFASHLRLIQIVDSALALAASRSGDWLVCKPGCAQCCTGVFEINQLDVLRLRRGFSELHSTEPQRALSLERRVAVSAKRLGAHYPGEVATGILGESDQDRDAFESFGNDEVCPVLNPENGTCDLYASRPMTCRVFGPPVRSEDGLGVCELCYHGATESEIEACEMIPDPCNLESALLSDLEARIQVSGRTIVTYALRS